MLLQVILALLAEIAGHAIRLTHSSNTLFFNIYFAVDLALMLQIAIHTGFLKKRIIYILAYSFIVTWILQLYYSGTQKLANWSFLYGCIILVSVFLYILYKNLSAMHVVPLRRKTTLLLCISVFVFYGAGIPLYAFLNYLIDYHPLLAKRLFSINIMLEVVRYLIIAAIFYINRPNLSLTHDS